MHTDPYEIKIGGAILTVRPEEDGSYKVFRGETELAHLHPEVEDNKTTWETYNWIDDEYAGLIGEAIEEYEHINYKL